MRPLSICCLLVTAAALAQSSLNRYDELSSARTQLTSEFAKIQDQLKSKEDAKRSAGETGLSNLSAKVESLRDDLVKANQRLIEAFNVNYQPQSYSVSNIYFFGAYDPSATIVATLAKMMTENKVLAKITLADVPPFSPQDINNYQQVLDRLKRGIEEHRHAANNYDTTLTQRQRKPVKPAKTPGKLPQ
jgi:flagellar biosynthesis chaperone FliJ